MAQWGMAGDWGERRAAGYDQRVRELFPEYEELHARTDAFLGDEASVLVVGAGTGYEAGRLAQRGVRVTAVDPSADMLAKGPKRPEITYVVGYVSDLPMDATFDAATCLLVMQFLPVEGKRQLLAEMATRVKPGGKLALVDAAGDLNSPDFQAAMRDWEASLATRSTPEQLARDLAGIRDKVVFIPLPELEGLFREAGWRPTLEWRPGILSLWSAVREG